jgi:hypothetical protein
MKLHIDAYKLGVAFGYAIMENMYFDWNVFPQSDAELIADGIAALMFVLAISVTKED